MLLGIGMGSNQYTEFVPLLVILDILLETKYILTLIAISFLGANGTGSFNWLIQSTCSKPFFSLACPPGWRMLNLTHFFKSSHSSFSFNHQDISIHASLQLYYTDDLAFEASTETVNNIAKMIKEIKNFSSQNWKIKWHFWLFLFLPFKVKSF